MDSTPADPESLLRHGDFVRALARGLCRMSRRPTTWRRMCGLRRSARGATRARAWLAGITKNISRDWWRSRGRRRAREEWAARPERLPSAADLVEREAIRRRVVEAVLALEEPYQQIVLLRYSRICRRARSRGNLGFPWRRRGRARSGRSSGCAPRSTRSSAASGAAGACSSFRWRGRRRARGGESWDRSRGPIVGGDRGVVDLRRGGELARRRGARRAARGMATAEPQQKESARGSRERALPIPRIGVTRGGARSQENGDHGSRRGSRRPAGRGALVAGFPATRAATVNPDAGSIPNEEVFVTRSDGDGRFALPFDGKSVLMTLYAEASGFAAACVPFARLGAEVTIRLEPGAAMQGCVYDYQENRSPARASAGAPSSRGRAVARGHDRRGRQVSDRWASFAAEPAAGGAPARLGRRRGARLRARHFPLWHRPRSGGGVPRRDFYLGRGGILLGIGRRRRQRAADPQHSGRPLVGPRGQQCPTEARRLSQESIQPRRPRRGEERRRGSFPIREPASVGDAMGHVPVTPIPTNRPSDSWERTARLRPGAAEVLLPTEGQTQRSVIRLWPGATIRGKVVNAKAQPVAGIRLGASSQATACGRHAIGGRRGNRRGAGGGRTDESGAYSLELAARRASDTKITIRASGDWPLDEAQTGEIALSLRAGEAITRPDLVVADSGRRSARILVRDAAGAPIPGALVSRDAFDAGQAVATDSQGYAILGFPGANPGEANAPTRAWAHAEGFALASSNEFTPSAESPPEVVIRLTPGFAIGGRIVRADGSPRAMSPFSSRRPRSRSTT